MRRYNYSMPKLEQIDAPNATLLLDQAFISEQESLTLLNTLIHDVKWRQDQVHIFGKHHYIPRLQCFQGEPELQYRYSNLCLTAEPWHPLVKQLKEQIEQAYQATFNVVLINYYRDGQDKMGWHSDDETELGNNPTIASISLGAQRRFAMRHKKDKQRKLTFDLANGSLLVMSGETQHFWQHSVPATQRIHTPRINLTFRYIHT